MSVRTTDAVLTESATEARIRRQLPAFAVIGVLSGLAYIALFAVLTDAMSFYLANTLALGITAVANTAANRHFTFGLRDTTASERMAHQVKGLVAFAISLAVTNGLLALLHAVDRHPAHWLELGVLVAANVVATASRFLLMRIWVFMPRTG